MSEQSEYEAERAARLRKTERAKIALAVYRDLVRVSVECEDPEEGIDYGRLADNAVFAADALLDRLDEARPDHAAGRLQDFGREDR